MPRPKKPLPEEPEIDSNDEAIAEHDTFQELEPDAERRESFDKDEPDDQLGDSDPAPPEG